MPKKQKSSGDKKIYYTDDGREIVRFIWAKGKPIPLVKGDNGELVVGVGKTDLNSFAMGNQTHKEFVTSIERAKVSRPFKDRWRVDVHTEKEYDEKRCKCWKSKGGSTVAITSDGDIISVCKYKDDPTASGSLLLERAVKMGGIKLDSFAGNHNFYVKNGFEPVSWTPFSIQYAPPGWNKNFKQEPVIFYRYVGKGRVKNIDVANFLADKSKCFTGDDGYNNAMKYRDNEIKRLKGEK